MVRIEGLKRQFGARVVFQDVSWLIPPAARVGLVGPNGAGKTTLLRILDGRDTPDAGSVHKSSSMRIGYLPQEVETVERGHVLAVVLGGYAELSEIESRLERLGESLATSVPGSEEAVRLTEQYGALRQRFEQLDGDRIEARAKAILSGLGVAVEEFHLPLETLSGGWRMRVILARLLLSAPDLLLMDEPTNHLDLEAIDWLEGFLETYEGAFIVVSHDRYFLNRMVRDTVELAGGRLSVYPGNYDAYLAAREVRTAALEKAAQQQAKELKKTERFIERFRYKNTKAKQVQSRILALSKTERIQTEGQRKKLQFGFPPAPRSGDIVVRAEGAIQRYGEHVVYDGLDLLLRRGDRVALIGPNGAGKSTLLKLLSGRLQLSGGVLDLGHKVIPSYYAQHQLDELDPAATLLEEIQRVAPAQQQLRLRKLLGSFLFTGDDVDKKVAVLSGGEKARLALAKLLLHPANLLLLDEPTNHLDLQSREVLEEALDEYDGTLVVISHDRYFINRVVTSVAVIGKGKAIQHPGDYDEYQEWKRRRTQDVLDAGQEEQTEDTGPTGAESRKQARRREADERNRRYREEQVVQRRLAPLEEEIAKAEERLRLTEAQMADPEVYSDTVRAAEIGKARLEAERMLEDLYRRWEELAGD